MKFSKLSFKILPIIVMTHLFMGEGYAQSDRLKYYTEKKIINFKGKDLNFNGVTLEVINSKDSDSILLKVNSDEKNLKEVYLLVENDNPNKSKLFLIIDGEKHLVKLINNFKYTNNANKKFTLTPTGILTKAKDEYHRSHASHRSHSSHSSHRSHYSAIPN